MGKCEKRGQGAGGLGGLLGRGLHRCAEVRVDISVSHTPNFQKKAEMRSGVAVIPSLSLLSNLFLILAVYLFVPFKSLEFFSQHTHTLRTTKALFFLKANKLDEVGYIICAYWHQVMSVLGEKIDDSRE